MKVTIKDLKNFNGKCANGFGLDIQHAVVWNEKRCRATTELGNGNALEIVYEFSADGKDIHRVFSEWKPTATEGVYVRVKGFYEIICPNLRNKKYSSDLQACTTSMTIEELRKRYFELADGE